MYRKYLASLLFQVKNDRFSFCLKTSFLLLGIMRTSSWMNVLKSESLPIAGCLDSLVKYRASPSHLSDNIGDQLIFYFLQGLPFSVMKATPRPVILSQYPAGVGITVPVPLYLLDRAECRAWTSPICLFTVWYVLPPSRLLWILNK